MNALLLLTALLAASPARAASAEESALARLRSDDPAAREQACADLARAPKRGPRVYPALSLVMDRDASDQVRLAAVEAVITFPGNDALTRAQSFLQSEPGEKTRGAMIEALAAEPSRLEDPGVTDLMSRTLAEDPSPWVRLAAVAALARRKDERGLAAVLRAAKNDRDKAVRAAARDAARTLAAPRPRPQPPGPKAAPKPDAVKGKDACPAPWGWCECNGPIKRPPKCLTRPDCRLEVDTLIQMGMPCQWNGSPFDAPGD